MNLTHDIRKNLELCEMAYCRKMFGDTGRVLSHSKKISGAFAFAVPSIDVLAFNRVIGLGQDSKITVDDLNEVTEFFISSGSKRFMIQLPPYLLSDEVSKMLTESGFRHHNNWTKHFMEIDSFELKQVKSALQIREVRQDEAELFGSIVSKVFEWPDDLSVINTLTVGLPGYSHFFVTEDDKPISTGAMHVNGEFVSMALAATLPEHRSKGAQKLLLNHRITLAKKMSCKFAVTETGEDKPENPNLSSRNMTKFGFQIAYLRANFVKGLV